MLRIFIKIIEKSNKNLGKSMLMSFGRCRFQIILHNPFIILLGGDYYICV